MAAMTVTGVRLVRGEVGVLDRVDLALGPGERVGLVGRSGSGKTSLLRVMAGLDAPAAGEVVVGGRAMSGTRREVTLVFQDDAVYDHLDVFDNLEFPFRVTARVGGDRIVEAADRFRIRNLLARPASELSAGQRHVVAAARALIRPEVRVVLLDEPMVGTDPHRRSLLVETILARPDLTVVISTNDPLDVLRWTERVVVLAGGGIAQTGVPIEVYRRPGSLEVAEVMGEINRIPAVIGEAEVPGERLVMVGGSRLTPGQAAPDLRPGDRVVLGVRPADLRPALASVPFHRRLRATVGRLEPVGARQRAYFGIGATAGTGFVAEVESHHRIRPGDHLDWEIPAPALLLFDPVSGRRL